VLAAFADHPAISIESFMESTTTLTPQPLDQKSLPPPGDSVWTELVSRLHAALKRADYGRCQWLPTNRRALALPLEPANLWHFLTHGRRRLLEPTAMPGLYRRLERIRSPLVVPLWSFFGAGEPAEQTQLEQLLAQLDVAIPCDELLELGLAQRLADGRLRSRLRFIPHGQLILVSDVLDRSIPDFTYIGRDSLKLADVLKAALGEKRFRRGLDICSGSGIQGLTLAACTDEVVGAEINPRSVAFANLNARLNGFEGCAQFFQGDLASDVQGKFDIVVSNPPFMFMSPEIAAENRDGYGGEFGLEIVSRIISDLDRLLSDDGEAYLLSASPVVHGTSMLEAAIQRALAPTNLGAELTALHYRVDPVFCSFQRTQGMRYEIAYFIHISRKLPHGVAVQGVRGLSWLANRAYVELANLWYR
jgi:hypothetical protein